MLNTEDAVGKAKEAIHQLFPDFASGDLRLEEIETPLSAAKWRLTFSSANSEESTGNSIADMLRPRRVRKTVELDADGGNLVSIKAA